MSVVDTSVLVSLLRASDVNRPVAVEWFEQTRADERLMTPSLALVEVAATLTRAKQTRQEVEGAIALIQEWFEIAEVTPELMLEAREVALACGTRGCDSVFVALARNSQTRLVTFDVDQAKRSDGYVLVECLRGL